ncbi:PepSY domain-containing protein [Chitinophaga sp. Mgbs1]|uniref:PepSY domain-containing protein n=1 Tax=Chitinophaga solisilvae TaxID=1233460 RepID=A0A433WB17_9BACT|nr:PepSY domain-containing protein [Chitinophaga solisilvae]
MELKKRLTKIAFKIHGWIGLTTGALLLLFGLTGAMLMFRADLDHYFNNDLHMLQPGSTQVPVDSIYRMLVRSHPNLKKIVLHDFPVDRYDSYEFMLYKNQQGITDNYLYFVFVNPYTGKILKEGSYQDIVPSFFRWLYSFHYSLQLGAPGKLIAAIVGLVMLLSLVTGTIVYRKHFWAALRFKAGLNFKNRRTAVSSLHRIIGVWAVVFNFVLFFTGFWMNKDFFRPGAWAIKEPILNQGTPANIDSVISKASAVRGFTPIAVTLPTLPGQDILVRGKMAATSFFLLQGKASDISFSAITGQLKEIRVIDQQSREKRFDWEIYQLHIGAFGGNFVRWLYVVLGLSPGVLALTGALLWLKRKR